jgi:hypothetical protein
MIVHDIDRREPAGGREKDVSTTPGKRVVGGGSWVKAKGKR